MPDSTMVADTPADLLQTLSPSCGDGGREENQLLLASRHVPMTSTTLTLSLTV
jgi:hypothetical protein